MRSLLAGKLIVAQQWDETAFKKHFNISHLHFLVLHYLLVTILSQEPNTPHVRYDNSSETVFSFMAVHMKSWIKQTKNTLKNIQQCKFTDVNKGMVYHSKPHGRTQVSRRVRLWPCGEEQITFLFPCWPSGEQYAKSWIRLRWFFSFLWRKKSTDCGFIGAKEKKWDLTTAN